MSSEKGQIRIYIKPKDVKKTNVSIKAIADFFTNIQNILYQVCEDTIESQYRQSGRYPDFVTDNCELVLKEMKIGSADALVALSQSQKRLPFPEIGPLNIGELAISKTDHLIDIAGTKDDINHEVAVIITNPDRRYSVLSSIYAIWPDTDSKYEYSLAVGKKKLQKMNSKRKPIIKAALDEEAPLTEKTVYGRLVEVNVTKKNSCQIETSEGRFDCKFNANLEDKIINNVRHFVSLSGILKDSRTILIENDNAIKQIREIPLYQITIDGKLQDLVNPIKLRMEYDKNTNRYLVENAQLDIFSIENTLLAAVEDVKIQINMLWKGYVEENPSKLTEGAMEYRELIKNLLEAK
jgi:hypothetical protein